ncbi:MAG: HEAT repeat domain-containing protein [Bradymonadaceae bacterium]
MEVVVEELPVEEPVPEPEPEPIPDPGPAIDLAFHAIDEAMERATRHVAGWRALPPEQLSFEEILNRNRLIEGPRSMGGIRDGRLSEAAELPLEGPHHSIIERHRSRDTRFGSAIMIEAILHGAEQVAEDFPGSILRVGNISRERGGAMPWSVSHRAGRDADLAFYTIREEDGQSIPAPDLLHFDDEGRSIEMPELLFDVERNWALVRGLLNHPEAGIQWLFISEGLKFLLLEHAIGIGEDAEIIERASVVLHQPTNALPHNDHFHLRVACDRRDRLEGCIDSPPLWSWNDSHEDALLARSLELRRALDHRDSSVRLAALDFLVRIRSPFIAEIALVDGVWNSDPVVRQRSLELASQNPQWSATALVASARFINHYDTTLQERAVTYSILRRSLDPWAAQFALGRLMDEAISPREKVYAARALAHHMKPELVPILLEELAIQPGAVRSEIVRVLQRITNQTHDTIDWTTANEAARAQHLEKWWHWWEKNGERDRREWLQDSFTASYGLDELVFDSIDAVDHLIPLLRDAPEHVVYNTNVLLREHTRRWAPLELDDGEELYQYWSRWWKSNRERMLEREVPTALNP